LIVLDTLIEKLKPKKNRPWGPGDNPMTAVKKFMKDKSNVFKQDFDLEYKSYLTVAPNGFYERIK
jgi:cephalosporin hydroxylase